MARQQPGVSSDFDQQASDKPVRVRRKGDAPFQLSRRGMLTGAAIGGGLLVAWLAWPRDYSGPIEPEVGEFVFGAWLTIARDGVVTVAVPQLEMGQGVTTILPQIVATELGADWRQIAVQPVPPSGAYPNVPLAAQWAPLWMPLASALADEPDDWLAARFARRNAFNATAWGTTLAAYEGSCREAGATARAMLIEAAADIWDVAPEECEAANGFVLYGNRRARFGELAEAAAQLSPPSDPPLRSQPPNEQPETFGASPEIAFPRLDLPAKVDGSLVFAGDVRLPESLFASIRHAPIGGGDLAEFDVEAAADIRGLQEVVRSRRWLAAVASDWWSAERALQAMRPRFGGAGLADSDEIATLLENALEDGEGERIADLGEIADDAVPEYASDFAIDPAVHATIEPASATARYTPGRLELWIAAQAPEQARRAAAKAVGLSLDEVVLYPMPAGGSFDARLSHAHAIEVAVIAQTVGRPVTLMWPRRQELLATPPRPPLRARLSVSMADGGERIRTLWSRVAMPPFMRETGHRMFDNYTAQSAIEAARGEPDPLAVQGFVPPYALPGFSLEHVPVSLPLPTGPLRSNSAGIGAFCTECFIDEIAGREGLEPLSFRISMLADDPRLVACLQKAASMAQWDGARRGTGQGIACWKLTLPTESGMAEGRIACIADMPPGEGGPRVSKLTAAVDLGRIVNLDMARQQIEGGLIFGTSLALGSSVEYRGGLPVEHDLSSLDLPTLATAPRIELSFLPGDGPPFDPGELGAVIAPPAIANAMFSALGKRIRTLPLTRDLPQAPPRPAADPVPAETPIPEPEPMPDELDGGFEDEEGTIA